MADTTLRRSHTLTNIKPMLQAHRARSVFFSAALSVVISDL